jgi:hypothetical protein
MGCVDHVAGCDDDADVRDVGCAGAVEDKIARFRVLPRGKPRSGVVLSLGGARDGDAGGFVGGVGEAGAVETEGSGLGSVAGPFVR